MSTTLSRNDYMEQAIQDQERLERDLKNRCRSAIAASPTDETDFEAGGTPGIAAASVECRITGFWRWKNVVVPPNAWVVHTRRGYSDPVHCGLGVSFRFDPWTDAFLVVPAAMQTILINARCISKERQGVLVQGYVQWIIDDFRTAYRKCDFADPLDPMRLVTVQLREQAEAAIKDKVATLSIDEVLADKQPIVKELTGRLRDVMEGHSEDGDRGLGLRIVTVQIKEAIVSSPTVWEMLQRPFRAERSKEARLAELASAAIVGTREAEASRAAAKLRIDTESEGARLEAAAEAAAFDREQAEQVRRTRVEAEARAATIAMEKETISRNAELERLKLEVELSREDLRKSAHGRWEEKSLALEAERRRIENGITPEALQASLVRALPEIAERLPKPVESRTVTIGPGADGIGSLIGSLAAVLETFKAASHGKARAS